MHRVSKNAVPALLLMGTLCGLLLACGNKGDLYLPTTEKVLVPSNAIDDALDELELMEAEEEKDKKS